VRPIVLASASPRRQEILGNAGIAFVVQPSHVPEFPGQGESPTDYAERLAREKAMEVGKQRPQDFILGADTVVVVDGTMLEKPSDAQDAARMLRLLSGKIHQVTTGVCLASPALRTENRELRTASETTLVTMTTLIDADMSAYIATGEPMDKAGAYAIQGIASRWITRIEGDYFNVVGLPVALVYRLLREAGAFS
jgi:septum formation protein